MKKAIATGITFGLVSLSFGALVACGNSQETKKYNDMKQGALSADQARSENQVAPDGVSGNFIIVKADDGQIFNVLEGGQAVFKGLANVAVQGVQFKVSAANLPLGASFATQADPQTGIQHWAVTYKAPTGKIPAGKDSVDFQFQVVVSATSSDAGIQQELNSELAAGNGKASFTVTVRKASDKPVVTNISGLQDKVQEGTAVPFTVTVVDPGSLGGAAPQISIAKDPLDISLVGAVDVSSLVEVDSKASAPQNLGNGAWKYSFVLNTVGKQVPRPAKSSSSDGSTAMGTFAINMTSASKQVGTHNQRFTVALDLSGQMPAFAAKDSTQEKATAGVVNKFDVTVSLPQDSKGMLKFETAKTVAALKGLVGSPKAQCKATAAKDQLNCEIQFKPACTVADGTKEVLQLVATNTVGGIAATQTWSSAQITIATAADCGKPAVSKKSTADAKKAPAAPATAPVANKPAAPGSKPATSTSQGPISKSSSTGGQL